MSAVHVEVTGQGEPLALIHGWGMHGGVWQPVIDKLQAYFTLHIVDLPGMGLSREVQAHDLDDMVQALLPVLPPRFSVCGWSLGGLVAMRLAMQHPQRVNKLLLVGSTPRFINTEPTQESAWQYGMAASVFEQFASQVVEDYAATLIKFLTLQCMGAEDARATIKQLRQAISVRPAPTQAGLQVALDILLHNDLRAGIPALQAPALLIHGDRDTLAPVQAAHWLAQHLPHAQLRVLAGAGHAPFLSHQAAFVEYLMHFLLPVKTS